MDIFKRLFQKTGTAGVFSFVFPQAPAGLQNPEYLRAYKGWVYACVKRKADSIATMEFTIQRKQGDEWEEITTGPALEPLKLLTTVNPFLSSDGLYRGTSSYLDLVGNSFWYVAYNKRRTPTELWQLDPTKIEVIKDARNFIGGWVYTNPQGKRIKLRVDEVIPFQEFNPLDPYRGLGPTEAGALAIDTNQYANEWNRNFFFNSAMPSMVLETEQALSDEQFDRLETKWLAKFQGLRNAHRPTVLEGGLKVNVLNKGQKDMDFTNQLHVLRDEILATFGVPKVLLGISETGDSRSDAEGAEYVFAKYTLAPRMRFIATTLTEFYLPLWGLNPAEYRIYAADCVPRNAEMDLKRTESGLMHGYATINEVRAQEGKKPVEGGDTVFVPSTWKPIELAINPPDPILPGGGNEKPKPAKTFRKEASDTLVAEREALLTQLITQYQLNYQAIFQRMNKALQDKLATQKAARKKASSEEIANDLVRLLFADWNDWIGILHSPTRDELQAALNLGGRESIAQLDTDISFDQLNPAVMDWLNENALEHATSVTGTVKEELITRLMAGVEQGLSARDIAASFSEFFDTQSQWRALRIARTEAIAGYAQGSLTAYHQAGLKMKQWLTAGDATVDPECVMNAGQGAIPINSNFASGHQAPPVHPNCRCTLLPVVPE